MKHVKETQGITPEIVAAISAGIGIVLGEDRAKPGKSRQGILALRINRTQRVWIDSGRQNNMNNRLVR
ncbi:hypothetical protein [Sporomusa acidovorans]|uniref:Uncharacterized protein n=1 Tax=Sporomusa acidovorans (strain ATCC 49682 / DSM 3132 / Mol) TaxID=1123286 RepID=A0ABZ3IZ58_SPOA4|nr:hypothetical protein [Sporomusa acidovorans]OZC17272.1 hypothetical protein SPACI_39220 [Sporomusa acidovorans DSM 3132]SDF16269.1 hypothetical protein SAMN04488499_103555 [Sporomusa acidovorans]